MSKELKEGWFVKDSIGDTLKNLLETADLPYLKKVSPVEFEKLLIHEVHFLCPYTENEECIVKKYIRRHLSELYQFTQSLTS